MRTSSKQLFLKILQSDPTAATCWQIHMGTIITTENTPVRRTGTGLHLIINTAFTILLPESDILDVSFCDYYLVMVSIQVSPIVMQILYDW